MTYNAVSSKWQPQTPSISQAQAYIVGYCSAVGTNYLSVPNRIPLFISQVGYTVSDQGGAIFNINDQYSIIINQAGQFSATFLAVASANGINYTVYYTPNALTPPVQIILATAAQNQGTMGFTISGQFNPGIYIFGLDAITNLTGNPSFSFRYIPSNTTVTQTTILNQNLTDLIDVNLSSTPVDGQLLAYNGTSNKWDVSNANLNFISPAFWQIVSTDQNNPAAGIVGVYPLLYSSGTILN